MKIGSPATLLIGTLLITLSGCSLFNIDLNTGVEPLPSKELNTRILLHEYASNFSNRVEKVADSVIQTTDDKDIRLNALYWKINAISVSRQMIFQTVPYASLVDTWTFTMQHRDFLASDMGTELFGAYQPSVVKVASGLEQKVATIARVVSTRKEFNSYEKFATGYAAEHPFTTIEFRRESILSQLNEALGIPDSAAVGTVGTMPEAVSDLTSRVNDYSSSIPKLTRWRTQAYLYESGVDSVDIKAVMDSIALLTSKVSYIAENSPELLDSAMVKFNRQVAPLVNKLDARWSETLWKLGEERAALMEALDYQRMAIMDTLTNEREVIMADLSVLSKELVDHRGCISRD